MTGCEEPGSAALDAYISAQLDKAADTHASHIDTRARLEIIQQARGKNANHDGTAAAED
jgi:hypothetical protein